MKKHILKLAAVVSMMVVCVVLLSSCGEKKTGNRVTGGSDIQTFNYCYVMLGDKEIVKGTVAQWRDYTNSDVVQVLVGGRYYLTHYSNVVLIADPDYGSLEYRTVWKDDHEVSN